MRGRWLNRGLILMLYRLCLVLGILAMLCNKGVHVRQVDLSSNEVVDFGRVVLNCLHLLLLRYSSQLIVGC